MQGGVMAAIILSGRSGACLEGWTDLVQPKLWWPWRNTVSCSLNLERPSLCTWYLVNFCTVAGPLFYLCFLMLAHRLYAVPSSYARPIGWISWFYWPFIDGGGYSGKNIC